MENKNLTITIFTGETPTGVFDAINNVEAWWTGEPGVEGKATKIGDEFTYRYSDIHYSKQRVTELIPGKKIVWAIVDSQLNFIKSKNEWTGTTIIFEIFQTNNKTEVRFTHEGLAENKECYSACSDAWSSYITGSLKNFIAKGKMQTS